LKVVVQGGTIVTKKRATSKKQPTFFCGEKKWCSEGKMGSLGKVPNTRPVWGRERGPRAGAVIRHEDPTGKKKEGDDP